MTEVHDESCEGDWGPEGQESPCQCGERSAEDECTHDDFSTARIGSGMVRMECLDCGATVQADIDEWGTR